MPVGSTMLEQLKAEVVKAQARVATDRAAYVKAKGNLSGLPIPVDPPN
jgi:hypothetical protein